MAQARSMAFDRLFGPCRRTPPTVLRDGGPPVHLLRVLGPDHDRRTQAKLSIIDALPFSPLLRGLGL